MIYAKTFNKWLRFLKNWDDNKTHLKWSYDIGKGYKRYMFGFLLTNFLAMLISLASSIAGNYVVDAATPKP